MQVSFVGLGGNGLALRFALGDRVVITPSCVESHGVLGNSPRTASVFGLLRKHHAGGLAQRAQA